MDGLAERFERRLWEVVARLLPPLDSADGVPESELAVAEERLGFLLPDILRAFYRLAGRREDITQAHCEFYALDDLETDGTALLFYDDNMSEVHWGLRRGGSEDPDPPVLQADDETVLIWKPFQDRLSDFLIAMTVWQAVLGGMAEGSEGVTTRENVDRAMAAGWEPIPELAVWGLEGYMQQDRVCVFKETTSGYTTAWTAYAGGATPEDVSAIGEAFGIAWNE
jgi:hypothetical protein